MHIANFTRVPLMDVGVSYAFQDTERGDGVSNRADLQWITAQVAIIQLCEGLPGILITEGIKHYNIHVRRVENPIPLLKLAFNENITLEMSQSGLVASIVQIHHNGVDFVGKHHISFNSFDAWKRFINMGLDAIEQGQKYDRDIQAAFDEGLATLPVDG